MASFRIAQCFFLAVSVFAAVHSRSLESIDRSEEPAIGDDVKSMDDGYSGFLLEEPTIDELIESSATASDTFEFNQENDTVLVEMDMLYTTEQWDELQNMTMDGEQYKARTSGLWTDRIIPYTIASGFSSNDRNQIKLSVDEWNKYTCLTLRPRRSERNYVTIVDGNGCSSYIGRRGGAQRLTLARNCRSKRVIVHEFGHAVGFYHEQARTDRDSYVTILWSNVRKGQEHNFKKQTSSRVTSRGVSYDYGSIMHYGQSTFSGNGKRTITTKDSSWQSRIGRASGLSFPDIKLTNIIYNCGSKCGNKKCPSGGYLDQNCRCQCRGTPIKAC